MKKALLVDDSKSARMIIGRMLKKMDLDVVVAEDGFNALELLKTNTPDLIFMDYMMPGMNGIETMHKIHAQNNTKNTPVIMCTGNENDDEIELFIAEGAVDVLAKPPSMDAIRRILGSVEQQLQGSPEVEVPITDTTRSSTKPLAPPPIASEPTFAQQDETMISLAAKKPSLHDIMGAEKSNVSTEAIKQMVLNLVNSQVEVVLKQKVDALDAEMTNFRDDMVSEAKKVARTEARISASQSVDSALASTVDKRIQDKTEELDDKFSNVQENMHEEAGEVARSEAGSLVAQLVKTVLPEAVTKQIKKVDKELDSKLKSMHHDLMKHALEQAKEESLKTSRSTGKQIEQNINTNLSKITSQITPRLDKISKKLAQQTEEVVKKTEQRITVDLTEQTDGKIDDLRKYLLQQVYFYSGVGALTGATIAFLIVVFF